jgi:glycosyltransferase involved in cell wall biosynthesis
MPEVPPLPPIATEPISVVLLAHNAAAHLQTVVAGWLAHLENLKRDYRLILIDDASTDGSREQAAALQETHPRVQVLQHATHQGEGAALRSALAVARQPLLFYTLCDPRYQPSDLDRLLKEIDSVDLVSGYRAGRPVPWPLRILGSSWRIFCRVVFADAPPRLPGWLGWKGHAGRLVVRILYGVRYHDVACPYRLLRRAIFDRIPLQSNGSFVHVEILAKANYLGHLMGEEVPLAVVPKAGEDLGSLATECYRMFKCPDFGPVATLRDSAS